MQLVILGVMIALIAVQATQTMDAGIITEEEFAAKKRQLLGIQKVKKIQYKEEDVSRILHTLFCGMIFVVSVLSGLMLPEGSYSETYRNIIHNLILVALWVMNIDCLILWFTKDTSKPDYNGSMHPEAIEEVLQAFYQKLQSGNLGDIKEGHNDV